MRAISQDSIKDGRFDTCDNCRAIFLPSKKNNVTSCHERHASCRCLSTAAGLIYYSNLMVIRNEETFWVFSTPGSHLSPAVTVSYFATFVSCQLTTLTLLVRTSRHENSMLLFVHAHLWRCFFVNASLCPRHWNSTSSVLHVVCTLRR